MKFAGDFSFVMQEILSTGIFDFTTIIIRIFLICYIGFDVIWKVPVLFW